VSISQRGLAEWIRELDKMAKVNTAKLDPAWRSIFRDTQSLVHVESGALRASGRAKTEHSADEWTGDITYGGTSQCDYAIYEQRRGGTHDFLRNIPEYEETIERVIGDIMEGK
jgi:hypothetical protein